MPTLQIQVIPSGKRVILVKLIDGKPVGAGDKIDPHSRPARTRVAKAFGIPEADLSTLLASGEAAVHTLVAPPPRTDLYTTRDVEAAEGETHSDWRAALAGLPTSRVLCWTGRESLCCLDVDYHGPGPKPTRSWLEGVVLARLAPKPVLWHFSRSGGLHLFYTDAEPFTAEELAAAAALRFRTIDPTAGLELKTQVRGPGDERLFTSPTQDTGGVLSEWLGVDRAEPEGVAEWLADNGMEPGGRYDHSRCPIDPAASAERDPVTVGDRGIYCHRCGGKGYSLGSRKAGFAPWSAILGSPSSGDVGSMIRNLCHWGHARLVLTERYDMPEALARVAYGAACKAYHHGKASAQLVPGVFCRDTQDMARVNNAWTAVAQSYIYQREGLPALIAELPAAQWTDGEKVKAIPASVAELGQGKDLTARGYPNVEVVHGFRFAHTFLRPADRTVVPVVNAEIVSAGSRFMPRYARGDEEAAWAVIGRIMPGLDRNLIKLVLCSLGCAQETKAGMPPLVFVTGPAGAAKTTTVKVGAAIAGCKSADLVYDEDTRAFREGFVMAVQKSGLVMVNEILKDAERGRRRQSARSALDPFLNLTPDSASKVPYLSYVTLGRVPAVFLTEPTLPMYIREETQIARRLRHVRLHGRKDEWLQTMPKHAPGLNPAAMHRLRLVSAEVADACNVILGSVVDEFFQEPMTFDQMADALGAHTVEQSDEFEDVTPYLRELFRQVCLAPAITNERLTAAYANGYKRISRSESGTADMLVTLWSMFADGGGADWTQSRKLTEKDWSAVLKTDAPVQIDIKTDSVSVFLRFRTGPLKAPLAVNGAIVDPTSWETGV